MHPYVKLVFSTNHSHMSKLDHQPHEIFYVYIIIYTWFLLV